ncbi:MAG: cold shock domain-containing protein, partial [Cyanobacteriota bacterium]
GFIKPEDGSKEVFLHISALKRADRRPKVGDTIFYERVAEADGKVRAAKASIQGVTDQSLQTKPASRKQGVAARPSLQTQPAPRKQGLLKSVVSLGALAVIALFTTLSPTRSAPPIRATTTPAGSASPMRAVTNQECVIKGNISISTGDKLYHLPGMEDYERTIIHPEKGERWFCTESEAIENGWRKAPK